MSNKSCRIVLSINNIFVFCALMANSIISISMGERSIINIIDMINIFIAIANLIVGIINLKNISKKR